MKWGLISKSGEEIVSAKYQSIEPFKGDYARVSVDDKYGFIDKTGKEIIACQYDDTEDIENGLVKVNSMGMWGYVNIKGEEIVPCMYVAVGKPDCELRTPVKLSLKWGYIDSLGMDIAPAKYDTIGNFVNNLAIAKPFQPMDKYDTTKIHNEKY